MFKEDLWCGYCGTQDFRELVRPTLPDDSSHSAWQCTMCGAEFEDNPGYGYFTSYWGSNEQGTPEKYSLNTGELLDDSKLPRTPEGIVRHSSSREELEKYLMSTQIK